MPLAIQQPFFLPYAAYFSLIHTCDEWISFDTPQYVRKSWYNRNQVLDPNGVAQWITAPVKKHAQRTAFKDIGVAEGSEWKQRILNQLQHYRKRAKNYAETVALLSEAFETKHSTLVDLNESLLAHVCDYLSIDFKPLRFSTSGISVPSDTPAGEWALEICKATKHNDYISLAPSRSILDLEQFKAQSISLRFVDSIPAPYPQFTPDFVPNLSIIDVLLNNTREEAKQIVRSYRLSES